MNSTKCSFSTDKILDSLPDNLTYDYHESTHRISASEKIPVNYNWGPYTIIDSAGAKLNNTNKNEIWNNIETVHADWVMLLINTTLNNDDSTEAETTNVKLILDKNQSSIQLIAKVEILPNTEIRSEMIFIDDSTKSQLSNNSNESTTVIDTDNTNNNTNSSNNNTNEKTGGKTCKYCGISFSHQYTLDAHMNYYCSRRQINDSNNSNTNSTNASNGNSNSNNNNSNTNNSINNNNSIIHQSRYQKTWRTRQRNRQASNQKLPQTDSLNFPAGAVPNNIFSEEDLNKLKLLEHEQQQRAAAVAVAAAAAGICNLAKKSGATSQQQSMLQSYLSFNGPVSSGNKDLNHNHHHQHHHTAPTNSTTPVQPTVVSGTNCTTAGGGSSDSDTETRAHSVTHGNSSSGLCFCSPCGLFFASKELYEVHLRLDMAAIQSSASQCASLVLAAPVVCHGSGGVQYVPVHPRTNGWPPVNQQTKTSNTNMDEGLIGSYNSAAPLDLSVTSNNNNNIANKSLLIPPDKLDHLVAVAAAAAVRLSNNNNITAPPTCASSVSNISLPNNTISQHSAPVQNQETKRPWQCQNCQTRFQLFSTFQAHQQFYCQSNSNSNTNSSSLNTTIKRKLDNNNNTPGSGTQNQSSSLNNINSPSDKRPRYPNTTAPVNNSNTNDNTTIRDGSPVSTNLLNIRTDDCAEYWTPLVQGFKCLACGFIGQTKRGIRIHCKNQCIKSKQHHQQQHQRQHTPIPNLTTSEPEIKSEEIEVCCSPNIEEAYPISINSIIKQEPELEDNSQNIRNNNCSLIGHSDSNSSSHESLVEVDQIK